jgi:hypothetical protein
LHTTTEDKENLIKDNFYEELGEVFNQVPEYHMKTLPRDFNAKVGREDIFKPISGDESLHEASNDIAIRLAISTTSKNLNIMSATFPHQDIYNTFLLLLMSLIIRFIMS